ncbi:hypothetical protein CGMCC3_g9389 [Colletotrichum fructicola]|nr:uncharacterized protein CGMCC3_g9389 [Colletotrichum fructicola]KAE9574633.1 hypothetical protein CGMCC3_g9389 [Colletotrichum fructicola]
MVYGLYGQFRAKTYLLYESTERETLICARVGQIPLPLLPRGPCHVK